MKRVLWLLLLPLTIHAETFYATVPGEGWSLKVDAPPMTHLKGEASGRRYRLVASSVETGITLSLHSEVNGAGSSAECKDTYWPLSRDNLVVKSDIQMSETSDFQFVTHLSEVELRGIRYKTANGHAYFVKNGLCLDLHVSHWPYQQGSEKRVEDILRSAVVVR